MNRRFVGAAAIIVAVFLPVASAQAFLVALSVAMVKGRLVRSGRLLVAWSGASLAVSPASSGSMSVLASVLMSSNKDARRISIAKI